MEYHIASIDYLRFCRKTELYLELSTINHVFIPENNTEYDSEDPEGMEDENIPEFIPVSLCNYRPDGILVCDSKDYENECIQISFEDFKKEFWIDSKKRDCPVCQRKVKTLLKKEEKERIRTHLKKILSHVDNYNLNDYEKNNVKIALLNARVKDFQLEIDLCQKDEEDSPFIIELKKQINETVIFISELQKLLKRKVSK